jgi:hypothetical protein
MLKSGSVVTAPLIGSKRQNEGSPIPELKSHQPTTSATELDWTGERRSEASLKLTGLDTNTTPA